jgi:hypothetical protein
MLIPAYGTLLGIVRDNAPIDGDDDLDFWTNPEDSEQIKSTLIEHGYTMGINSGSFFNFYDYSGVQIDFYELIDDGEYYLDNWNWSCMPYVRIEKSMLYPLEEKNGVEIPQQAEKLVKYLYGERYMEKLSKNEYRIIVDNGEVHVHYLPHSEVDNGEVHVHYLPHSEVDNGEVHVHYLPHSEHSS